MTSSSHAATEALDFRGWLAKRTDDELAALLRHRPDTAQPLPPGIAPLATRLLLRTSLARALGDCTAAELAAIEDIARRGGESDPVPTDGLAADAATLDTLRAKALLFEPTPDTVMLPRDLLEALPADFGLLDQHVVEPAAVEELPADQRRILDTLVTTGIGSTRDAAIDADPARPVPQLIAAGLLQRVDSHTVRLPRAVRAALRGERVVPIPLVASGRQGDPVPDSRANDAGAAAGLEVVRHMGSLIEILGQRPIDLLKDKAVGVRHVAGLAKELGLQSPEEAARLIDLGFHARLLGRGEPKNGPEGNFLAPTEASVEWADAPLAERLEHLVEAWMSSPWAAWESTRGLDPESAHERLPRHRATVLDVYRHTAQPLGPEDFWEDLRFASPLFATHTQPATIDCLRAEAEWLGVIARGVLVTERPVPAAVDSLILQADMTVLTPGPLDTPLLRVLESVADLESPGLASVYRITADSIRRGMDSGLSAAEIEGFFSEHALGEVPQAVSVLISDVARRHGTLRSGPALCYVRCDDEALLAQAVSAVSTRSGGLLRALAPTVAVSTERLGVVLEALRDAGFAPAAEDATGASIDVRPAPALLPTPRATPARAHELDLSLIHI